MLNVLALVGPSRGFAALWIDVMLWKNARRTFFHNITPIQTSAAGASKRSDTL
jgi:hypothetical protein